MQNSAQSALALKGLAKAIMCLFGLCRPMAASLCNKFINARRLFRNFVIRSSPLYLHTKKCSFINHPPKSSEHISRTVSSQNEVSIHWNNCKSQSTQMAHYCPRSLIRRNLDWFDEAKADFSGRLNKYNVLTPRRLNQVSVVNLDIGLNSFEKSC